MFRVLVLLVAGLLASCTQGQLEYQSDAFNRAIATSSNEQLLLNAVRSSLDLPLSFTKFVKYTGKENIGGTFVPKLPFGPDAPRVFDLGPTLSWSPGIQSVEYNDVNIGTAIEKLNTNLTYADFERYLRAGDYHPQLVFTVLMDYLEVHSILFDALTQEYQAACIATAGRKPPPCVELRWIEEECPEAMRPRSAELGKKQRYYNFVNNAATKCGFLSFQVIFNLLSLSKFATSMETEEYVVKVKDDQGKETKQTKTKVSVRSFFQEVRTRQAYDNAQKKLARLKMKDAGPMVFGFRSPKAVVVFLGQLIALQHYSKNKYVPKITLADGTRMVVFRVLLGTAGSEGAALSVVGPHGNAYHVPHPSYGAVDRDQTLRVLTIASEQVNAAISEKLLPPSTTIVVR
jgi:hypothetical protein